jgi:hypothetical protein
VPWISLALIGLMLVASVGYYRYHTRQIEVERIALEAAKAKTAAETAAKLAEAEESRLAQLVLQQNSRADEARRRETEIARREGQKIHYDLQSAETQAAREKEQAARQVKYERMQEEQAAQARIRNQTAAMQRALAIPIARH